MISLLIKLALQKKVHQDGGKHEQPGESLLVENPENGYIMAHHDRERWITICEKLRPIAYGKASLEAVSQVIHFFINDARLQSKYCRTKEKGSMNLMFREIFDNLSQKERRIYKDRIFPWLAQLILETEILFPLNQKIRILKQGESQVGSLEKIQCACLIAHMVFCITVDQAEHLQLSNLIDFSALYLDSTRKLSLAKKVQKIRCIFAYFERVLIENPQGNVVFERLSLEGLQNDDDAWADCDETMTKAEIIPQGDIIDHQKKLQVVFSDHQLGNEVLQLATTQQPIQYLIHPELIISILLCEELKEDETVRVYGAGRYSNFKGYGDTFEFAGAYIGDNLTERFHVIMDANKYGKNQAASQFGQDWLIRELNKAYCGLNQERSGDERRVATGKWGCGVFQGNPQLKFLIQWLAASRAGREMWFCSYEDAENFKTEETDKIWNYYKGKKVGELYEDLRDMTWKMQEIKKDEDAKNKNLFKVLIAQKIERQADQEA